MASLLLSPLASSNLDSIYDSNIEGNIKRIEMEQIKQLENAPEFIKQFDELAFDNISDPTGINEAYSNVSGMNSSLQRNLDFQAGYSAFQESDMHYDVVSKNKFVHNNMVPSTSRRDFSVDPRRTQRKLETFTGKFSEYTPKKEKLPLFEPMSDLTFPNGMPNVTDKMKNRYIPSNKNNNGDLPFEANVRVRPGVDEMNQEGQYGVYRVMPRDVNALRSEINQKVTFENKPLETIKKGEQRAPNPTLTKSKKPDFREQKFDDLVGSRAAADGGYTTGKYTNMNTSRNITENYQPGPAINRNKGGGPDKDKMVFGDAKRENYMNDGTYGFNPTNKVGMNNKESFSNVETQRASTNIMYEAPVNMRTAGNYAIDYKDIPLTTLRELMIDGDKNISISGPQEKSGYVFSKDMILPTTNRQLTSEKKPVLGANSEVKAGNIALSDKAKQTVRESTSHNMVTNAVNIEKFTYVSNNDKAKPTIRENVSHNMVLGAKGEVNSGSLPFNDKAKQTIKENTMHNIVLGARAENNSGTLALTDKAKQTIKENTMHNIVLGARGENNSGTLGLNDKAKPTIKEFTSHNIVLGARGENNNGSLPLNDKAKTTIRENASHNIVLGARAENNSGSLALTDKAKPTIKESTLAATPGKNFNNMNMGTYMKDKLDVAKTTIRQQTENTKFVGHLNNMSSSTYTKLQDEVRPTIKQTTLSATPSVNVNNTNMGSYTLDENDVARTTLKQTTMLLDYKGIESSEFKKHISSEAALNMEIDERREITTFNRAANGRADLNGPYIDRDNVKLNEPIHFSYTSAPLKRLDNSVMPRVTRDFIENVYAKSKPVIETSSYYVNDNFINTLKNNPLVNDIYHQKNV